VSHCKAIYTSGSTNASEINFYIKKFRILVMIGSHRELRCIAGIQTGGTQAL
jgi:hypothetical protein